MAEILCLIAVMLFSFRVKLFSTEQVLNKFNKFNQCNDLCVRFLQWRSTEKFASFFVCPGDFPFISLKNTDFLYEFDQ